jgi:acyl dehydratase
MIVFDTTEPNALGFGEISEHDCVVQKIRFGRDEVQQFCELVQDFAPVHCDRSFAQKAGYDDIVVHGLFISARFSRMLGMYLPGPNSVIQSLKLDFRNPVYVGRELDYNVTVTRLVAAVGAIQLDLSIHEQGMILVSGKGQCVFSGGNN